MPDKSFLSELSALIEQSILLTDENKRSLLAMLPTLDAARAASLRTMLESESQQILSALTDFVRVEIGENHNEEAASTLKAFFQRSGRELRKAREKDGQEDDADTLAALDEKIQKGL